MQSAAQRVRKRIWSKGRGWVFTPKDFLDLAQRSNVDFILHNLVQDSTVRRIGHGLYDFPRQHPKLGDLSPDRLGVAQAIARQNGDTICPTGAQAANILGLSTQVPAKPVFATTGKAKTVNLGKSHITLVPTRVPPFQKNGKGFLVLQALDYLGKDDRVLSCGSLQHRLESTRQAQPAPETQKPPRMAVFCGKLVVQSNFELKFSTFAGLNLFILKSNDYMMNSKMTLGSNPALGIEPDFKKRAPYQFFQASGDSPWLS